MPAGRGQAVVTTAMHDHGRRFSLGAGDRRRAAGAAALRLGSGRRRRYRAAAGARTARSQYLQARPGEALRHRPRSLPRLGGGSKFTTEPRAVRNCRGPVPAGLPGRGRITLPEHGYLPCGYFQLWNARATGYRDYPIHGAGTAEGSDLMHAARFPRQYRELIPELVGIQLETDGPADPVGVNWAGRRTAEFSAEGGTVPEMSKDRTYLRECGSRSARSHFQSEPSLPSRLPIVVESSQSGRPTTSTDASLQ